MKFVKALLLFLVCSVAFVGTVYSQDDEEDEIINDGGDEEGSVGEDAEDGEDILNLHTPEAEEEQAPNPDVELNVLFTTPADQVFQPNSFVSMLIGFYNKAGTAGALASDKEFTVDYVEAFFRHPQDNTYYLQNFTQMRYSKDVFAGQQASMHYQFFIHESFHSRSLALLVNVVYHDEHDRYHQAAVFNETIKITDVNDSLDGETIFMYLLLLVLALLLVFVFHQLLTTYGRKHIPSSSRSYTNGDMGKGSSDYVNPDWIPTEVLKKEAQRTSQARSPKPQKAKKDN